VIAAPPPGQSPIPHQSHTAERAVEHRSLFGAWVSPASERRPHRTHFSRVANLSSARVHWPACHVLGPPPRHLAALDRTRILPRSPGQGIVRRSE
jgi:hypothetical protein